MKHTLLFMGFISGFLALLGCNNPSASKTPAADSGGKVQTINTNNLLMTLPTIENTFPAFEDKSDTSNLKLIEDDWRQVEFVSKAQKNLIDREIDSINYIFEHEMHQGKDYTAFKKLHVRQLIVNPVSISFDRLLEYFGKNQKVSGISISGNNGQVKNGFSFTSNGMSYYGLKDAGNTVTAFCLYGAQSKEALLQSIDGLSELLAKENLYLVDWVSQNVIDETNVKNSFTR